jgi:hypothetical protein
VHEHTNSAAAIKTADAAFFPKNMTLHYIVIPAKAGIHFGRR